MGSFNTKLEHPDKKKSKDGLRAMQGWIGSKLKTFYLEVEEQLIQGGGGKANAIPVISIIDKDSNIFIKEETHTQNNISESVQGAIENVISGDWKHAITDIVKGGMNVFLGPRRTENEGRMQEHKSFHIVWSDTALLRLDNYVLRYDVSTESDFEKEAEFFVGHMLIISIVDINKVSPQIISYEIMKFLDVASKSKDNKEILVYKSPKEKLMKQIHDCKDIAVGVFSLLDMISQHQKKKPVPQLPG